MQAKSAHKTFLQLNDNSLETSDQKSLLFANAERNYVAAAKIMSRKLADSFVNVDISCIVIGLISLTLVTILCIESIQFLCLTR